jgi:hypothetical protein
MHALAAAERATWDGVTRLADPQITAASGIAGGAHLVQRGTAPGLVPLVFSLALGALVVRLGRAGAARLFGATIGLAFAAPALAPLLGPPRLVWWGLVGAPFGFAAGRRLVNEGSNARRVVMAQRWALTGFLLMAAGSALGLVEG